MGLVSGSIPNFINGISQQPDALRLASQGDFQDNGYSTVVEGLTKRPPTKHVAKLLSGDYSTAKVHVIDRDVDERYVVTLTDGDLKVNGIDGAAKTVTFPNGKGYLDVTAAQTDFDIITIADYTFIVNKTKVVELDTTVWHQHIPIALVYVREGDYSKVYTVKIDSTTFTHTSHATDVTKITTDYIAEQLRAAIDADASFDAVRVGSTIKVNKSAGTDFTMQVSDSIGDGAMIGIKGKIQSFADLPQRAFDEFQVQVTGDPSTGFDNYYVEYDESSGAEGDGVWVERPQPGRAIRLKSSTMPHALVRQSDGSFVFDQINWADAEVGDDESSPHPSFVGTTITGVFFDHNRLGFIADENTISSRTADFFNFYRSTVTALLDSDPIDVAVSYDKVSILKHVVPFSGELLLFSDKTQFKYGSAQGALTLDTVEITPTTEYQSSDKSKPVSIGQNVYFGTLKGGYTTMREYYLNSTTQTNEADEITAHVPKFIPGEADSIISSSNEDVILALTPSARNMIYVYKFFFAGQDKQQSSWSSWSFPEGDSILGGAFIESTLFIAVQRSDGLYLDRMDIAPGQTDTGIDYTILLDRRVDISDLVMSYDADTDKTTVTLPYTEAGALQAVTNGEHPTKPPGVILVSTQPNSTHIVINGDQTGGGVFIGRPYEFRYRFSKIFVRQNTNDGGQVARLEGRLQLRDMSINFADTGYLRVEVTPFRREMSTYVFSGRVVGSARSLLGVPGLEDGTIRFPILTRNENLLIEIVNDKPLPSRLLNADWSAEYSVKSQRIS